LEDSVLTSEAVVKVDLEIAGVLSWYKRCFFMYYFGR